MTTVTQLNDYELQFKKFLEDTVSNDSVINRYNKYYKWLNSEMKKDNDEKLFISIFLSKLRLLYSFVQWLDRRNIKAIEISKNWDKKLIARVGSYCKELIQHRKEGTLGDATFKIKEYFVHQDLFYAEDLATAAYCCKIIQNEIPYLFEGLIQTYEAQLQDKPIETNSNIKERQGCNGTIKDDGRKYWHTGANELMTYDECTEKGLSHHLLMDVEKRWYVGFSELDKTKIKPVENVEWVDAVVAD